MSDLDLRAGDRYGLYEILEPIGRGAFATVYRVRTPRREEIAALKISNTPLSDHAAIERTLREIAILRQLSSDHVVRIFDAGRGPDGRVYILMELLEGGQLDHVHDFRRPMLVQQAVGLVHKACLGLAEGHAHGIVHRDLKPENIWVEPQGNVRVIDFGLARSWNASSTIGANVTMSHVLIGTPRYMQPEQLTTSKLTPASDVYSLAILLYELLTARSIFFPREPLVKVRERLRHDPIQWIQAHARELPTPLDRHRTRGELPPSLVELVHRCLDKNPDERPRDAGELSIALSEVLHYEFGTIEAATLQITHPWGGVDEQLILPGSYRIGSDPHCECTLRDDKLGAFHAILDWQGLPRYPQLRPLVIDGSVRWRDRPLGRRIQLQRNDTFDIGPYRFKLEYPR